MKRRANAITLIILVMDEYFSHSIPNGAHIPEIYVGSSCSISEMFSTSVCLTYVDFFSSDSYSEFVCSSSSLSKVGHSSLVSSTKSGLATITDCMTDCAYQIHGS